MLRYDAHFISLFDFSKMSDKTPIASTPESTSPTMPSNSFSVKNLLSENQKTDESNSHLIKPIPMPCTPTTSSNSQPSFPLPHYCASFLQSTIPGQLPTTPISPHPIAIMNAMAALNGGVVDPAALLMLQTLTAARTQPMTTLTSSARPTAGSPHDQNTSNSSSPRCMIPNAGFPNWLTPSTELSSSSSSGLFLVLYANFIIRF